MNRLASIIRRQTLYSSSRQYAHDSADQAGDSVWSHGGIIHPQKPEDVPTRPPPPKCGDMPQPELIVREPYERPDGGTQYHGFVYYPRFKNEGDPPYDPAPLHLVRRKRKLAGTPWWVKQTMEELGLTGKPGEVVIVKNTPQMNKKLWMVKHVVEIIPLRIPVDLPDDADPAECFIKESGEFIYNPAIKASDKVLEEDEKLRLKRLDGELIVAEARKRWDYPFHVKL